MGCVRFLRAPGEPGCQHLCNPVINNLEVLTQTCPGLRAIAHNGGESARHTRHSARLGLPVYRLPSTSPANASWSFERKLAAWRLVMQACDLLPESGQHREISGKSWQNAAKLTKLGFCSH
jgi:hypothetical protein